MNDLKFNVGDVVKHKAANFKMVITHYDKDRLLYHCQWYNDSLNDFKNERFSEYQLEYYTE